MLGDSRASILYHDATANVADLSTGTGNDASNAPKYGSEIAMQS